MTHPRIIFFLATDGRLFCEQYDAAGLLSYRIIVEPDKAAKCWASLVGMFEKRKAREGS